MAFVFEGYASKESKAKPEKEGFVFEGYHEPKNEAGRLAMQGAIGLGKGAVYASPAAVPAIAGELALPGAIQNVIGELLESDIEHQALYPGEFPPLNREQIEQGAKEAESEILGEEGLVGGAVTAPFRIAGIETKPQTKAEKTTRGVAEFLELLRSGKADPNTLKKAAVSAFAGQHGKEALVEMGVPEWLAEIIGIGSAATLAHATPKVKGATKAANLVAEREALGAPEKGLAGKPSTKVAETFESGLTKPRAVNVKTPEHALISKGHKARSIEKLEKEAQALIKTSLEKHVPITKKIEEGVDFEKGYQESFGKLKEAAEKANPDIDTTPLNKFFSETTKKYRGIPQPHEEAKAVISEMKSFMRRVPSDLATLLKIRRSNGRKLNAIYERRLLEGKKQEYADFLTQMNKKIDESIQHTLPEDSKWFQEYSRLNKEYGAYKKGQKTLDLLEPILREKMSSSSLSKFADNPKFQKRLEIAVGEQGAKEIIQISKDLKKARDAIKRMSSDTYKSFNSVFSLGFFLKPVHWTRKAYGFYLSSPAKREAFDDALNAISKQDLKAYKESTSKLQHIEPVVKNPETFQENISKEAKSAAKELTKKEEIPKISLGERRKSALELKKKDIENRLQRVLGTEEKLKEQLKNDPSNETIKKVLKETQKLKSSSIKLLDDLEKEGTNLLSKKMVERTEKELAPKSKSIKDQTLQLTKNSINDFETKINHLKQMALEHPKNLSNKQQIRDFTKRKNELQKRLEDVSKMEEKDFYTEPASKRIPFDFEDKKQVAKRIREYQEKLKKLKSQKRQDADSQKQIKLLEDGIVSLKEILSDLQSGKSIY